MPPFLELQRDKSFRIRLIAICLGVALLISTTYIIMSYRLASDLGIKAELTSLHRQAMLLHAEMMEEGEQIDDIQKHLAELVNIIYLNDHESASEIYIEARKDGLNWSLNYNMTSSAKKHLIERMTSFVSQSEQNPMANGIESLGGERFLWQIVNMQGGKILIVESANSIEAALTLVIKRLSIISFIIFWVAIWLAITLSSWMTRRVQSKNDALAFLATHDQLTGLPNRLYLTNMMQGIMPENSKDNTTHQVEQLTGSLFVIDLDRFKDVNDSFGHSAGDTLLKMISERLLDSIETTHTLVRVGGDEFVLWAKGMTLENASLLAKKLCAVCDEPIMINNLAINTGASIGISHFPTHALNADSLIICADVAMYEAKEKRTGWRVFSERDSQFGKQRLRLRADLEPAFAYQQIKLYYQPKVELKTGNIIGVEALSRWYHPQEGILSPLHFIDLIEQSGRVQEFGRYVIKKAIQQMAIWKQDNIQMPIAINLSPYNLLDPGILEFTLTLLQEQDIAPNMLEIELTESSTSINIDYISSCLSHFKKAGIKLAIDDFGTGMSSLSYVSNLNVDTIKIDQSFINGIDKDKKKHAVTAAALTLAHSFESIGLAEGIESKVQLETLVKMGCLYGQGYYFSGPMHSEDMSNLLKKNTPLP